MNPREEIAHLTEVLERANHQYYVLDAPEMEDYDCLLYTSPSPRDRG